MGILSRGKNNKFQISRDNIDLLKTYEYSTKIYKICSKWCPLLSAIFWKCKIVYSTVESSMNWKRLRIGVSLFLRPDRGVMVFRYSHSQKSQGFKSGNLEGQAVGNCWLMILSSLRWRQSNCFTQRAICGRVPPCIKSLVVSHRNAWRGLL